MDPPGTRMPPRMHSPNNNNCRVSFPVDVDYQDFGLSAILSKLAKDGAWRAGMLESMSTCVSLRHLCAWGGGSENKSLLSELPPEGAIRTLCVPRSGDQKSCPALWLQTAGPCVPKAVADPERTEMERKGGKGGRSGFLKVPPADMNPFLRNRGKWGIVEGKKQAEEL